MKISIGTNFFKDNARQDVANHYFEVIHKKYEGIVNFYAFQKEISSNIPEFFSIEKLHRDSRDIVVGGSKSSPCIKDILDGLAETDCDYFVLLNSDIIIGDNFINKILENCWTGYSCSRVDIAPMKSVSDPLVAIRYEVAGFDAFVIQKKWYLDNKHLFKDYLMGSIWFDTALNTILKIYGQNDPFMNDYPYQIAHIFHGWGSGAPSPENEYNTKLYDSEPSIVRDSWAWYYHNILINRTPRNIHFELYPNEKNIEKTHFDKYITICKN
jgi:hypothetical protein